MPLYARAMGPADFAIVAVTNSLSAVLSIVLGVALYGCIPRLFFEFEERQRRAFFGTVLVLSVAIPATIVAGLYGLGVAGDLDVFATVRFEPHIRLVLFTSLFNVFLPLPSAVYMSRELPRKAAFLSALSGLSQLGLTLFFVAGLHRGAVGALEANLASAVLVGVLSLGLMLRMSDFSPALPGLGRALAFSLPLVPHLMANWALNISDRLVLERYVPAADVGRYSFGYMFGTIVSVVAASLGNALSPMANRQLKDESTAANVPPLGTYLLTATTAFALTVVLAAREVIAIIAPAAYAGAYEVVPWVVLGSVFQGMYLVWSIGTWFSMKTKLVPVITAISAVLNIGVNLVFIPRYGVMAAAVSTTVCYGTSAVLHGLLAQRLHPIAWEYRRWALLLGAGIACFFVGSALPLPDRAGGVWLLLFGKLLVAAVGFPAVLVATRFFSRSELARARSLASRALGGAG